MRSRWKHLVTDPKLLQILQPLKLWSVNYEPHYRIIKRYLSMDGVLNSPCLFEVNELLNISSLFWRYIDALESKFTFSCRWC